MHSSADAPIRSAQDLRFRVLERTLRVSCGSEALARIVIANYGLLADDDEDPGDDEPDLHYWIGERGGELSLLRRGGVEACAADTAGLLYLLEKDVTVALQRLRPELLFVHAAALVHRDRVFVLAGDSGRGKSTTAWGLLHHGFGYLSDELCPIELETLQVLPYPHALCLKRRPPPPYPLPDATLDLGETLHVPAAALPSPPAAGPHRLAAFVFVDYRARHPAPTLQPLRPAEAGARLYVCALNALAHARHGLDAAVDLAERVPCFHLAAAELRGTCEHLLRFADELR